MSDSTIRIGKVVWRDDDVVCAGCDGRLCAPSENWKDHALAVRGPAAQRLTPERFGPSYRLRPNSHVELAELFCPHCHGLLSVELYADGEEHRWDYQSLAVARERGYDPVAEFEAEPEKWVSF